MKKIFKSKRISNIIFGVLGLVIGGGIFGTLGIVATTNRLEAKYVMYTKNEETMTVQDAIKDLYVLAQNSNKCPEGYICEQSKLVTENKPIGTLGVAYYNPVEGKVCTESQYNTDLESYKTTNGVTTPTGQKDGCMKWYVFKEYDTSYTMILDHNTKSNVTFNSDGTYGDNSKKKEVQIELNNLVTTTKWKVTPRLIKAQEIANITGNTSWTIESTYDKWFYLDSNNQTQTATSTGASNYYWLFDYTAGCTGCGCKVADSNSNNYGYWTDTPVNNQIAAVWIVGLSGILSNLNANNTYYGLRPVITVQKSNF